MKRLVPLVLSVLLLTGCAETFLSRADLERRGYKIENGKTIPPTPTPTPTRTIAPYNNTDPRLGKVKLDKHCGFWSCQKTYMQCYGSILIITPADGSTPTRIPNAEECKP